MADKLLTVVDPSKFVISHSDYQGKPPADARRAIKKLLDQYQVGINPEPISPDRASKSGNAAGLAIMEGTTFVRVFYDNTDNTGKVKMGQPAVIDTVKGWGVTGINTKWGPDEYKIVGTFLDDYETSGAEDKKVVVKLENVVTVASEGEALATLNSDLDRPNLTASTGGANALDVLGRKIHFNLAPSGSARFFPDAPELPSVLGNIFLPKLNDQGKMIFQLAESGPVKIYNATPWKYYVNPSTTSSPTFLWGNDWTNTTVLRVEKRSGIYFLKGFWNSGPRATYEGQEFAIHIAGTDIPDNNNQKGHGLIAFREPGIENWLTTDGTFDLRQDTHQAFNKNYGDFTFLEKPNISVSEGKLTDITFSASGWREYEIEAEWSCILVSKNPTDFTNNWSVLQGITCYIQSAGNDSLRVVGRNFFSPTYLSIGAFPIDFSFPTPFLPPAVHIGTWIPSITAHGYGKTRVMARDKSAFQVSMAANGVNFLGSGFVDVNAPRVNLHITPTGHG